MGICSRCGCRTLVGCVGETDCRGELIEIESDGTNPSDREASGA